MEVDSKGMGTRIFNVWNGYQNILKNPVIELMSIEIIIDVIAPATQGSKIQPRVDTSGLAQKMWWYLRSCATISCAHIFIELIGACSKVATPTVIHIFSIIVPVHWSIRSLAMKVSIFHEDILKGFCFLYSHKILNALVPK